MSAPLTRRSAVFLFLLSFVAVYREVFEMFFIAMWSEKKQRRDCRRAACGHRDTRRGGLLDAARKDEVIADMNQVPHPNYENFAAY